MARLILALALIAVLNPVRVYAQDVYVTWNLPGWSTSGENPFNYNENAPANCIIAKQKRLADETTIFCGIGVGEKAASKDDKVYKEYFESVSKAFCGVLPAGEKVTPVPLVIGNVEYQKLLSTGDNIVAETLVGIENGQCVSYWYNGPPSEVKGYRAGVGKAKISFSKTQDKS